MNGELEDQLRKIEDFLEIDDKIITYKWISKALGVHTNTAKQLLYAYSKSSSINGKLLVTYVVAGERPDLEGVNVRLVNEKDVEEAKKKFDKITSVHVYSIQKGTMVSSAEIYNADSSYQLTSEDRKLSSIHPGDGIARRDLKVVPGTSGQASSTSSKAIDKKVVSNTQSSKPTKKSPTNDKDVPLNEAKQECVGRRTSPRKQSPKKVEKPEKKAPAAKNGSIGALFMKMTANKKEKLPVKEVDLTTESLENEEESTNNKEMKTPVRKSKGSSPSKKKRKKTTSKELTSKQRKRIKIASDSEGSNDESDPDERFPSPEPEPETPAVLESEEECEIIPATPQERGRKRVGKMVDKVFEDEEGYILTKKQYVTESCSDDETAEPAEIKLSEVSEKKTEQAEDVKVEKKSSKVASKSSSPGDQKNAVESCTKAPPKKPGRPAKVKATDSSTSKQKSIRSFFTKK